MNARQKKEAEKTAKYIIFFNVAQILTVLMIVVGFILFVYFLITK